MNPREKGGWLRWLAAAIGATVVVAGVVFLFRVPMTGPAPATLPQPVGVQLARPGAAGDLLKQEAEMRDLRPLFLPTNRNAALPEPKREAGRTILEIELPKWSFGDTDPQIGRALPPVATLAGKPVEKADPADALSISSAETPLLGFGRREVEIEAIPARGAFVEVVSVQDGGRVLAETLPAAARPDGGRPWSPVEFLAALNPAGLVAPLVVTDGSRVEEVDNHFRNYLTDRFRIGVRLPPGYYRITVAP